MIVIYVGLWSSSGHCRRLYNRSYFVLACLSFFLMRSGKHCDLCPMNLFHPACFTEASSVESACKSLAVLLMLRV